MKITLKIFFCPRIFKKISMILSFTLMTKVHVNKTKECMEIIYDLYIDALLFSHRGKNLAPASHPNQIPLLLLGSTWSSRITKKSYIDNTRSRSENIPKFVHSAARTVMCHLTTSSHHHHTTIHQPSHRHHLAPKARHPHDIRPHEHYRLPPLRHLMMVFRHHRHESYQALTLHFWAKKTWMTLIFNIWKYVKY